MNDMVINSKEVFANVMQIGIVVKDIDQTISKLTEILGLGPFRRITYPPIDRQDVQTEYYGLPGDFSAHFAFTQVGSIELELIQPLEGKSVWADFFQKHGEGLHHIRFNVQEIEPVIEYFADRQIEVSQSGTGLRLGTKFVYFNSEDRLGFTIEILNTLPGTDGRTPQIVDGKVIS
jgi:methylmalonyl-CoA/ethylmalonyl-CoA epimerase